MYCADDNSCTSDSCDPLEGCIYIDICEGPVCGNGILEEERCDDYNTESGDGCSSTCEVEYCGDGIVNNGYYEGGYGDGD